MVGPWPASSIQYEEKKKNITESEDKILDCGAGRQSHLALADSACKHAVVSWCVKYDVSAPFCLNKKI